MKTAVPEQTHGPVLWGVSTFQSKMHILKMLLVTYAKIFSFAGWWVIPLAHLMLTLYSQKQENRKAGYV